MKRILYLRHAPSPLSGVQARQIPAELDALSERVAELVAELEELNKQLTAENNALKSELNTTTR